MWLRTVTYLQIALPALFQCRLLGPTSSLMACCLVALEALSCICSTALGSLSVLHWRHDVSGCPRGVIVRCTANRPVYPSSQAQEYVGHPLMQPLLRCLARSVRVYGLDFETHLGGARVVFVRVILPWTL